MGNLNANYGSELHLLRWLGLHRDDLTRKVEGVTALTGLQWKQFEFSHGKTKYDAELRNLNFLDPDDWDGGVRDRFSKSIHPNWDAVATGMRNGQKYYVLVEAKAYPGEIADDKPHQGGTRRAAIKKELNAVAKEITGFDNLGDLWMGKYYQQANRLYTHWILDQFGIKSISVDIFFAVIILTKV